MKNTKPFERGQALVVIALAAVVLFGFAALAIDGSAKFSDRRHAQNAADTASLAGALALVNEDSDWKLDALERASGNGYGNDLVSNQVWVFKCDSLVDDRGGAPLDCGPYEGHSNYLSVVILSHVNTTFARVIGFDQTHNLVQAVALSKEGGTLGDGAMLIAYDPHPTCSSGLGSGGGSVDISGDSHVSLNGGGIFVNSQDNCGYYAPNCPDLTIVGGGVNSASTVDNIDQRDCPYPAPENINQDPIIIPDDVLWPDEPLECDKSKSPKAPQKLGDVYVGTPPKLTGEWLIYPGYYETFPPSDLVGNKQLIYMASGIYCIDPGGPSKGWDLSWSPVDSVSLNGSTDPVINKYAVHNPNGVTLYVKSGGGFSINANNPTYLDASNTGDYKGYLIILEGTHTSITSCSITGGAELIINGVIYAPYCSITVSGGSGTTAPVNAQLIGWRLKITGGAEVAINYDPDYAVEFKRRLGLMR